MRLRAVHPTTAHMQHAKLARGNGCADILPLPLASARRMMRKRYMKFNRIFHGEDRNNKK